MEMHDGLDVNGFRLNGTEPSSLKALPYLRKHRFCWNGFDLPGPDLIPPPDGFRSPKATIVFLYERVQALCQTICQQSPGICREGQSLFSELLDRNSHRAKIAPFLGEGKSEPA